MHKITILFLFCLGLLSAGNAEKSGRIAEPAWQGALTVKEDITTSQGVRRGLTPLEGFHLSLALPEGYGEDAMPDEFFKEYRSVVLFVNDQNFSYTTDMRVADYMKAGTVEEHVFSSHQELEVHRHEVPADTLYVIVRIELLGIDNITRSIDECVEISDSNVEMFSLLAPSFAEGEGELSNDNFKLVTTDGSNTSVPFLDFFGEDSSVSKRIEAISVTIKPSSNFVEEVKMLTFEKSYSNISELTNFSWVGFGPGEYHVAFQILFQNGKAIHIEGDCTIRKIEDGRSKDPIVLKRGEGLPVKVPDFPLSKVDLWFLVDSSGSMQDELSSISAHLGPVVKFMESSLTDIRIGAAAAGHGDTDKNGNIVTDFEILFEATRNLDKIELINQRLGVGAAEPIFISLNKLYAHLETTTPKDRLILICIVTDEVDPFYSQARRAKRKIPLETIVNGIDQERASVFVFLGQNDDQTERELRGFYTDALRDLDDSFGGVYSTRASSMQFQDLFEMVEKSLKVVSRDAFLSLKILSSGSTERFGVPVLPSPCIKGHQFSYGCLLENNIDTVFFSVGEESHADIDSSVVVELLGRSGVLLERRTVIFSD